MKKSAKEIFEELGYEELEDEYYSYTTDTGYFLNIQFDTSTKQIIFSMADDEVAINLDELNAINQQVKELGWNE